MTLDIGSLVGRVVLDDVTFQRTYVRLVRQFGELGAKATAAAGGTDRLDTSLSEAAAAGNAAASGLGHAEKAMTGAGVSASTAAMATGRLEAVTTRQGLAASKLTQATLRQEAAQARLTELEASGTASSRQLAGARASLIAANDRVALSSERLGAVTGLTSSAWQAAGRVGVVGGALVAAGFAVAAHAALDFDAKMALVRTLAKASDGDMRQLRQAALTVGQAYGYSAGQVADAEAELVKAGISVKDIMGGALRGALTLAAAGQEDVANATNTAAIAMTQFRLTGKDVPHIADLLAAGADKALGSVGDLSEALKYGGLAASQAGMSIEMTVGTLAELAQSGQLGSVAGSQLAMMLRNLQKPTTAAQAVMKQLGISVYDGSGKMLSFSAIAGELHDKIATLPPAQRDAALATLFTARAIRAANILMRDGAAGVDEWTQKVNAQGFAALQASGKLNSLSGDLTKFKSALQEALIGGGESAQGPLRGMVQDATSAVKAWNDLPGPVRTVAEALVGLGGAAALAGGAALLLIPKWMAMNAALAETRIGAISASAALKGLSRAGAAIAVLAALYEGLKAVEHALAPVPPDIDLLTSAVTIFAQKGQISGELAKAFGGHLGDLGDEATKIVSGGALDKLAEKLPFAHGFGGGDDIRKATEDFHALDDALTGLVTNGSADVAAGAFSRFNTQLHAAGLTTKQITTLFPGYAKALAASAASAKAAGTGVDEYGNAVSGAAQASKDATDAAKAYSDQLHAMADPLFAMNKAVQDLRGKQQALTAAVRKYGPSSRQAQQAQLDLASSALDVAAASRTLTASVKGGTTSVGAASRTLHSWVAAGLITESQAKAVARSFGGIIDKAGKVDRAIVKSAGGMKAAGQTIGESFAQGVAIGIANGSIGAEKEAIILARKTAAAARGKHGFNSNSPSKVGVRIGGEFPEGVGLGIARSTHISTSAAIGMVQAAITATQNQLQTARGNAASMSSGITSGITGAFGLSGAPDVSAKGMTSFLAYGAKATSQFDALERRLIRAHLAPALVQQLEGIFESDPGKGIAAARNILASGGAGIHRFDLLERTIGRNAARTGQALSNQQYGAGIDRLVHKLGALESELHHLRNDVANISREAKLQQHKATVRSGK